MANKTLIIGIIVLFIILCLGLRLGLGIYFFMGGEEAPVTAPVEETEPNAESLPAPAIESKAAPVPTPVIESKAEPVPAPVPVQVPVKNDQPWRVEERIDYPGGDIFHYHPNSNPIANEKVCLDKCMSMDNCKLVTFNKAKTLCWGKKVANNRREHGDRFNYFKV